VADLKIDSRRDGAFGLVTLGGEARLEVIDGLRAAARGLKADGAKHILLSMKDLVFVDSASVGAVLELQRECADAGGLLVLYALPGRLARMLDAMGLTGRLRIAATEPAARLACLPAPA